jgi:antitoxin (DNA-binding transcriptional repressor) of toxin-antitoxin stability system
MIKDMENNNQISASDLKKPFLSLVDEVKNKPSSFIITKRTISIAKITPLVKDSTKGPRNYFGFMKGTAKIKDDIVNYSSELDWEVCNG